MALWCRRHVFCLTSTHYLLFLLIVFVSSFYQVFLFCNSFFSPIPFLLIFHLLETCFPCLQPKKSPPHPTPKRKNLSFICVPLAIKCSRFRFQNYFLISCFLYVSILLSSFPSIQSSPAKFLEGKVFGNFCFPSVNSTTIFLKGGGGGKFTIFSIS